MPKKMTKRKMQRQKQARLQFWIRFLLSFFVVIVPAIALIFGVFGVAIPGIILGIYASAAFIIAGILIITFTTLGKFGFGEAGEYFIRASRYFMTKKEAKAIIVIFGGVMVAIGLALAILIFIYC